MMLRKYMSLIGIGSARVDLIIDKNKYRAGETVTGRFKLMGGTVEQQIRRIECDFVKTNNHTEEEETIGTVTILTSQQIDSGEHSQASFQFTLPSDIELTTQNISYHFKSKLIFDEGVKSLDFDPIFIIE
ncbi:sporulation protein [Neobacillus sp. LXY-4]|uniref:sporulation protein n=1 Tax=Neobacillus sp. LXY-4 TaxID=3379826 RepID=UPI003EE198E1